MKFLDDIKTRLGKSALKSSLSKERKTRVHNFDDARSIGLIYKEKGESFFILVKQYVKFLAEEYGIREILAMAYIDDKKQVPHWHIHRLKYEYFTKGDLNWKNIPDSTEVKNFTEKEFDILIDLDKEFCLPLRYVLAKSKANFKVGYYSEENENYYDMMIEVGKAATFDEYVGQVNHYLKLINTKHARA